MRRFLLVALVALAIWGLGRQVMKSVFAGRYPKPVSKDLYATDFRGDKAPELVVIKWLTEQPEMQGKVVIVDFWATWCGPCRGTIPVMNALQERFKDDVVIVGLSDETPETINAFRQTTPMNYYVATDPTGTMKHHMGIQGIPNVMIISTDGIVRWQGIPTLPDDPLTLDTVKAIVDVDPGVAKRRAAGNVALAH